MNGQDDCHVEFGADRVEGPNRGPGYVWYRGETFALAGGLDFGNGEKEVVIGYRKGSELFLGESGGEL